MIPHFFHKLTWGLGLITAGVIFMLSQIGLITLDIRELFSTYWPVFLIYSGLMGFIWKLKAHWGSSIWSLILCAVGVIFLLNNLHLTDLSVRQMFQFLGPAALIIFGISIIFKPSKSRADRYKDQGNGDWNSYRNSKKLHREERRDQHNLYRSEKRKSARGENPGRPLSEEEKEVLKDIHGEFAPDQHGEPWDRIEPDTEPDRQRPPYPPYEKKNKYYDDFVKNYNMEGAHIKSGFIGDVHLGQEPWELHPMVISHFIGDTVIDLTRASIPLGETPITVSSFIGDVKIFVPNDMDIEVKVTSNTCIGDLKVLDRYESGMFRHLSTQTMYYEEAQRKLVLTTNMFIGDVIVKKIG